MGEDSTGSSDVQQRSHEPTSDIPETSFLASPRELWGPGTALHVGSQVEQHQAGLHVLKLDPQLRLQPLKHLPPPCLSEADLNSEQKTKNEKSCHSTSWWSWLWDNVLYSFSPVPTDHGSSKNLKPTNIGRLFKKRDSDLEWLTHIDYLTCVGLFTQTLMREKEVFWFSLNSKKANWAKSIGAAGWQLKHKPLTPKPAFSLPDAVPLWKAE